jgi:hypothetical protein
MKKNFGCIDKRNPLTAKVARDLRRDRKELICTVLALVLCG